MQITFIGGGNMASALIGGLIKNGWSRESLAVVEIDAEARARVERDFAVRTHAEATAGAECIVLAVKPQQLREIAQALAPVVRNALVISIAAGVRASDLSRWLGGHRRVVRAMPNTPALVLAGMTGLYAAPDVSREDREGAEEILRAAGRTLWVASEEEIDAVTAISGSGPAYVFYFIEALEQAAADLGFDAEAARALALQTFSGAVKLAAQSTDDVATLRAKVTSKGGTTERALAQLEHDGVRAAVARAARAAAGRSRELGDALGADSTTK
jgi:pyrroline-5-carboxylate reductase